MFLVGKSKPHKWQVVEGSGQRFVKINAAIIVRSAVSFPPILIHELRPEQRVLPGLDEVRKRHIVVPERLG